jgi:hypothetical protein
MRNNENWTTIVCQAVEQEYSNNWRRNHLKTECGMKCKQYKTDTQYMYNKA